MIGPKVGVGGLPEVVTWGQQRSGHPQQVETCYTCFRTRLAGRGGVACERLSHKKRGDAGTGKKRYKDNFEY